MGWLSDLWDIASDILTSDKKKDNGSFNPDGIDPDLYSIDEIGGLGGSSSQSLPTVNVNGTLPAAIGAGSSALAAGMQFLGQRGANQSNAAQSAAQMAFQERMSSTSYQRGVKDLQKAGLNPMLAYTQGGASSPGGSQARMENTVGPAMGSALQAFETLNGVNKVVAETSNVRAQTQNVAAQTEVAKGMLPLQQAQIANTIAEETRNRSTAKQADAAAKNILAQVPGSEAGSKVAQGAWQADVTRRKEEARKSTADATRSELEIPKGSAYGDYYRSAAGRSEPYISLGADTLSSIVNSARSARQAARPYPTRGGK